MSSQIRKIARNKSAKPRSNPGTNSRGKPIGPRAVPALFKGNGGQSERLIAVSKHHELDKADPKCLDCGGSGIAATKLARGDRLPLACSCVPLKKEKAKEKADAT